MLITSLKPRISREHALTMLNQPLRRLLLGRLKYILDFYLPYRLFEVEVGNHSRTSSMLFAVDAVSGKLDHYRFDEAPIEDQIMEVETSHFAPVELNEQEALGLLEERLVRQAFLQGFFKISDLKTAGHETMSFYLPYWIGVYERRGRPRLEVIDGLRGRFEGAKLREIIAGWFQQ